MMRTAKPWTSMAAMPGPAGMPRSATRLSAARSTPATRPASWDPDDSIYGTKGGRIYCTALATLTLEVYYRFLRLYDDPNLPSSSTSRRADDPPATATRPRTGRTP